MTMKKAFAIWNIATMYDTAEEEIKAICSSDRVPPVWSTEYKICTVDEDHVSDLVRALKDIKEDGHIDRVFVEEFHFNLDEFNEDPNASIYGCFAYGSNFATGEDFLERRKDV